MEGLELLSFQIISSVGTARSMYIEAISLAKEGNIDEARSLVEEGNKCFVEGHRHHAKIIQKEATGESFEINLLLIHAEDQLMSAEAFGIIANEFIDLYERLDKK